MPSSTLRDVAREAGVSYQTVSRVINQHPYVAEETRERVEAAIRTLGYRPNKAARSLAGSRSFTLGLITVGINYYGPAQVIVHIEQAAREVGYDVVLANALDTSLPHIQEAVDRILRWQVDGILMLKPVEGITYAEAVPLCEGIPLVQLNGEYGTAIPAVMVDQRAGSRLATEYLLRLGHQQMVAISGPLHWFDARARHESWLETLATAGLSPVSWAEGDWTAPGGYAAARRLLHEGRSFTAVVVANDQMALGALRALREAGRRVPDDVSVVGFDDIPESAWFDPPLTTISQHFEALGQQGIAYLVDRIREPETPLEPRMITPQLIARGSTQAL
jgi:DNA-binding LacI/PurR family transcriptional regulator